MEYTDKELKDATQVAYLEFIEKSINNMKADGKSFPFKISDLLKGADLDNDDKQILAALPESVLNWRIKDIHNTKNENGFYACVIETSEDNAIVAFRGSEGLTRYKDLVYDWGKSDFGLLNNKETPQHTETERYANKLKEQEVLKQYKSVAVTGHSLGGNLASHFAIVNAYGNEKKEIFDKITQVVNFDGPGVSNKYLEYNDEAIKKAGSKIKHYKWSLIGSLLNPIPGSESKFLKIDENLYNKSLKDRILSVVSRHHTKSIMFDENGNAISGEQDKTAKGMSFISKIADKLPSFITDTIGYVASSIFKKFTYEKEDGTIGFKLPFSKKGNKRIYKEQSEETKCGELLKKFVGGIQTGAKEIQNSLGINSKKGRLDVAYAAANNMNFNRLEFDNFRNMLKTRQEDIKNSDRNFRQNEEYSK